MKNKLDSALRFSRTTRFTSALALSFLSSVAAHAAGFEKATLWSGHYTALGGAAASSVSGAEALYFNPAGLAAGDTLEISGNFSPTFSKFSGPIVVNQDKFEGNRSFSPVGGGFVSYKVTPKLGVGVGYYVSGGTKAVYEGVNYGGAGAAFASSNGTTKAELAITELSLGAGYELLDGLRLGLAYRVVMVKGALATGIVSSTSVQLLEVNDISATRWNGFRLGLQFAPKESPWGLAANWRTEVGFSGDGTTTFSAASALGGGQLAGTGGPATVSSTLPQAFDIGAHWEFIRANRGFVQYTFTEYNRDQILDIAGTVVTHPLQGSTTRNLSGIDQWWVNQHNLRFGFENTSVETWAFRAGYILTSQVTPKERARATFGSPGMGHTFTLGAGKSLMDRHLDLNLAVEYSLAAGTTANGETSPVAGEFSTNAFVGHLGATYRL